MTRKGGYASAQEYLAETQKFNVMANRWATITRGEMVQNVRTMTKKEKAEFFKYLRLRNNIQVSTRKNGYMGQIDRISYKFPLHGIWIHHGVSRGHPASLPRKKVDWFNSVIERRIDELANNAAEFFANAVINYDRLKIR